MVDVARPWVVLIKPQSWERHGLKRWHRAAYGRDQGIANTSPRPALYASRPGVSTRPRPISDVAPALDSVYYLDDH